MKAKINIIILVFALCFPVIAHSQIIKAVTPDTGSQGLSFPIVVHGSGTEFTLSPYFVVYFDSIGVGATNCVTINDTTLHADIYIDFRASLGYHRCVAVDQFFNYVYGDSSFFVFLNVPVAPVLSLPLNNAINVLQTPLMMWDSNKYAANFRLQISTSSDFNTLTFDTVLANTPYTVRSGVLQLNTLYYWRVNATNSKGTSPWSGVFNFTVRSVGITNLNNEVPTEYKLFQNFPNPFNPVTKFKFTIPKESQVLLRVYDLSGREIETLINQDMKTGVYEYRWDAGKLSSGIYFYSLEAGNYREMRRAVLVK